MSVRRLAVAITTATVGSTILASPAAAHTLTEPDEYVYGFTFDRLWSGIAALLAIGTVIVGGWLLARASRRGPQATRQSAMLVTGLAAFAIVNGILVVLTSDAGPGSGNGIVGGYIAAIIGLVGVVLGLLGLRRARRSESQPA